MYSGIAASIESSIGTIGDGATTIKGINFDSNWSSAAYNSLKEVLTNNLSSIETTKTNLETYASALRKTDEYIALEEEIAKLEATLSKLDENSAARISVAAQIATLKAKKEALKQEINGMISGLGAINGQSLTITFADWDTLLGKMDEYNKLPVTGNLFKALTITDENGNIVRDGEEYFNNTITQVRALHTGTDKTYYTTLAIIDLCLEAGVRLEYNHAGTGTGGVVTNDRSLRVGVPSSAVSTGTDCNAIASFLVFGDDSTAKWLSTGEFRENASTIVDYNQVVSGDVCTKTGHVGVILDYNQETDQYLIYEAKGQDADHKMTLMSGDSFRSTYTARRIDSEYVPDWLKNSIE